MYYLVIRGELCMRGAATKRRVRLEEKSLCFRCSSRVSTKKLIQPGDDAVLRCIDVGNAAVWLGDDWCFLSEALILCLAVRTSAKAS